MVFMSATSALQFGQSPLQPFFLVEGTGPFDGREVLPDAITGMPNLPNKTRCFGQLYSVVTPGSAQGPICARFELGSAVRQVPYLLCALSDPRTFNVHTG